MPLGVTLVVVLVQVVQMVVLVVQIVALVVLVMLATGEHKPAEGVSYSDRPPGSRGV